MTTTRIKVSCMLAAFLWAAGSAEGAAPAAPQGLITARAYYNITGTAVSALTNSASYPGKPDAVVFLPYFEWNATGDITTPPGNFADNYGSQIAGYFYPPTTGDYTFYLCSDDNSVLYLSTDSTPANKKLIAQETVYSNPREYSSSAGSSDLTAKDSSQFTGTQWPVKNDATGGAKITLQAGQAYYIEAVHKEGTGGDNLSVAVADPNFAIDYTAPIPGEFLSSDRTNGTVAIITQPQSQTADERGSATFRVEANGTPPYTYQWMRNGTAILDATNLTYTVSGAAIADNNTKYSVAVTGGQGTVTSQDAVLTVRADTNAPTVLNAKGSPNLTELVVTFSEPVDQTTASALANYQVSSSSGPLNITGATVTPSGTQVVLTTAPQTLGTKYTLLISGVKDTAAAPNTVAAGTKAVFFPSGKVVEQNGMIVIEAENYDRNLDSLWVRDTTRGTPSGGASMLIPNGAGGSENATKIEYDVDFAQAATYYVWIRASADNGNDDSVWFHIDEDLDGVTERPYERVDGNQDSVTGFQPQADFVWRNDSQDGPDPMSVDVPAPGTRAIAIVRREDGAFIDKILLTTDSAYTPTGFGPPETRQGAPGTPTATLTGPTAGQTFAAGGNIAIAVNAAGQSGLNITRVQYTANGNVIGESTSSPFGITWTNVPAGIYGIRAIATDELGQTVTSDSVAITVGTPPPQALLVVGTESSPTLNASDAGVKARLEAQGWQVGVVQAPASKTTDADGKQLIVVSSTVNSGDVGTKFRDLAVPVLFWEQAVQDDFLTTLNGTTDHGTVTNQTQINIVNSGHPLAGGLSTGLKTVTTAAQDYTYGVPNTNAVVIATIADNPAQAVIYGYDKGAVLADGTTHAAGRRVLFFSGNGGYAAFTDDAKKLLDAAVQWASGIAPNVKTSANIAWVSFHAADNTPSANAATAGFTNAPDAAYTALLQANGHKVTRFVTSGTPDTNVFNAFDLVIISRSVPSGDYSAAPSPWNKIKAPVMILGGYVIRANRLGLMTGNNIPDLTAPVKLVINDTNSPIFAGIQLDANNTMVNTYADLTAFKGTTNRGISVVTDPPSTGAKVLATVPADAPTAAGGTMIAEWDAGSTLADSSADVLAGKRLVFLTGSREYDGLTSEGAGIYDLSPDGAKMFINAVDYMAGVQPGSGGQEPTVSITRTANGIAVSYTGTLQSSSSITGGWTDVAGATSPFAVTANESMKFFRAKQ